MGFISFVKKTGFLLVASLLAITVSGCNGEKGAAFVGKWVSVDTGRPDQTLMVVEVVPDGGSFHINVENTIFKHTKTSRFEGKAESENVLSVTGAPILLNMRLEGGRMFFDGRELIKSK